MHASKHTLAGLGKTARRGGVPGPTTFGGPPSLKNTEKGVPDKGKGKGLGTYYSAAYETRTAALYNVGSDR